MFLLGKSGFVKLWDGGRTKIYSHFQEGTNHILGIEGGETTQGIVSLFIEPALPCSTTKAPPRTWGGGGGGVHLCFQQCLRLQMLRKGLGVSVLSLRL